MSKKKIIIISLIIVLIILASILSIVFASNEKNNNLSNEKIDSEIYYIDTILLSCFKNISSENSNWSDSKNEIIKIYSNWNSIIIDLSNIKINKNNLTDFGKKLDELMISINSKNKKTSIYNISNLYYLLKTYTECYEANSTLKINIAGRYYLIKSSSLLENDDWILVNENITKAEKNYYNYINNTIYDNRNFQIEKIYVSIKELENAILLKNKELFYIKFKIVIDNF